MSHYYATIQGNRKPRNCCGTKNSGISAHIRGWNHGIKVTLDYDPELKTEMILVEKTGGSNNPDLTTEIYRKN
jgi:hypothetical protein